MHLCEIRSISRHGLSRVRTFQAQGVALTYSSRSWSGVRRTDGVVVFAIPERCVEVGDDGCRCLLWWRSGAEAWLGREGSEERLAHCLLAVRAGSAEGFFVRADAVVAARDPLGLRVQKVAEQYWALWGYAAKVDWADWFAPRLPAVSGLAR